MSAAQQCHYERPVFGYNNIDFSIAQIAELEGTDTWSGAAGSMVEVSTLLKIYLEHGQSGYEHELPEAN